MVGGRDADEREGAHHRHGGKPPGKKLLDAVDKPHARGRLFKAVALVHAKVAPPGNREVDDGKHQRHAGNEDALACKATAADCGNARKDHAQAPAEGEHDGNRGAHKGAHEVALQQFARIVDGLAVLRKRNPKAKGRRNGVGRSLGRADFKDRQAGVDADVEDDEGDEEGVENGRDIHKGGLMVVLQLCSARSAAPLRIMVLCGAEGRRGEMRGN